MTFGLNINILRADAQRIAESLIQWFKERQIDYIVEKSAAKILGEKRRCSIEEISERSDILLSLGGDGTLLHLAHYAGPKPILGINLGRVGFLAEFSVDEMYPAIERILKKNYTLETRTQLEAQVKTSKKLVTLRALNDIIIERGAYPRMPTISLRIDGHHVSDYRADGLIVATSTGSTAYSMSAGGPIIVPKSRVFVITPICPHMLTVRPIVVSDDKQIELSVETPDEGFVLNCDGSQQLRLSPKHRVRIRKSEQVINLIANEKRNYYDVLRQKFLWGKEYL
ncbi:MAG: NAD(+)/NADH kinase [Chloroherpetonaceae bacterium]|nr:NAD(+)/NADH kinase [Chloroherpetonaceae bacterium]MCS7211987.1 NAD(+)/NADH kinase [Chloroherpetonaceae bacterium]